MYILRNALRNIMRSKARNILVGVIVFVIATSSCVALSIKQSAAKAEKDGLASLKITGQITVDRQKMIEQAQSSAGGDVRTRFTQVSSLTLDELKKYAGSAYVSDFFYTLSSSVSSGSDAFTPVDTNTTDSTSSDTSSSSSDNVRGNTMQGGMVERGFGRMGMQGDFSIKGYASESAMTDFVSGTSKISSGSMIDLTTSDNKCLITDELAAANELKVGDTITITNPNKEEETYTLTISGIYTNTNSGSSDDGMRFSTSMDPANLIITSVGTLTVIGDNSTATATSSTDDNGNETTTALRTQVAGTYVFKDQASFDAFKVDVTKMGLSDTYTVTSNDLSSYEQSLVPLKNLSKYAGVFLIIVLLIGGIILIVLNIFNIHERKYEVGVLTAIGMKKGKVAMQYVTEMFAVTIAAIIIGTAAGGALSVPTANTLLETQVSAQQSQSQQVDRNFGRANSAGNQGNGGPVIITGGGGGFLGQAPNSVVNYISNINASTNMLVVVQLLGIGILLTIFSSFAAVVFILRYEPLKILTSRT